MKFMATVINNNEQFTLTIKAYNEEMAIKDLYKFHKIKKVVEILEFYTYKKKYNYSINIIEKRSNNYNALKKYSSYK